MTSNSTITPSKTHVFPDLVFARLDRACRVCGVRESSPHAKAPCISVKPQSKTGFEGKTTRAVIENWLYNTEDISVLMDATTELRRRLSRAFPCPEWARTEK